MVLRPGPKRFPTQAPPSGNVLLAHPSSDLYGSDRVLLETVSGFIAAGRKVFVTIPATGPLVELLQERGADVRYCPSPVLRKSALRLRGLLQLIRDALAAWGPAIGLLRQTGADVVLVNTVTIPLWILVARLAGRRVVCHVHEAEGSQPAWTRRLLYLPLQLAHRIVCNSRFSRDVLTATWGSLRSRSVIVYNGVPGPGAEPQLPRREPQNAPKLLFLGRLSPRKGPDHAVLALAELRSRGVDASLSLLGEVFPGYEWFHAQLREQVVEAGLVGSVTFLGFDSDIWGHLAECDIALVPSVVDEPFGNTAVEAILALRPLVVSATSGLREAAEGYRATRFVPPGNPERIADAVQELLRDWQEVLTDLPQDRALALAKHAPEAYGQSIVTAVRGTAE